MLNSMHQVRDESTRSFGARIRGQATICKYTTKCPERQTNISYEEEILRDVLFKAIADPHIQTEMLIDEI